MDWVKLSLSDGLSAIQGIPSETRPLDLRAYYLQFEHLADADIADITDPREWLQEGIEWEREEKLQEAIACYSRSWTLDEQSLYSPCYPLRRLLRRLGYGDHLLVQVALPTIAQDDGAGWQRRGDRQRHASLYAQAIDSYSAALSVQPDNDAILSSCAYCHSGLGQHQIALRIYQDIRQRGGDSTFTHWSNLLYALKELGWYSDILTLTDSILDEKTAASLSSWDVRSMWASRGDMLHHFKRYDEALESYDMALAAGEDSATVNLKRGQTLAQLGHYEQAIAAYDQGLEKKPGSTDLWQARGQALEALGKGDEAANCYQQVTPRAIATQHYETGKWIYKLGLAGEALPILDQAVAADPTWDEAWHMRGVILDHWSRDLDDLNAVALAAQKWSEALDSWTKALALSQQPETIGKVHYDRACGYAVRCLEKKALPSLYAASLAMEPAELCRLLKQDSDLDRLRGHSKLISKLIQAD